MHLHVDHAALPHWLLVLVFASISACGEAEHDTVEAQQGAIVSGTGVAEGESLGTVGLLDVAGDEALDDLTPWTLAGRLFCSGTLIAPTVVLTAAHCVVECLPDQPRGCELPLIEECGSQPNPCWVRPARAQSVFVVGGLLDHDDVGRAEVVPVSQLVLHPGFNPFLFEPLEVDDCELTPDGVFVCLGLARGYNDVAVLLLEAPLAGSRPIPILPLDRAVEIPPDTPGLVQGYGAQLSPESSDLLPQDQFLSLLNETESLIERVSQEEILTREGPTSGSICFGDSGGPLYLRDRGDWYLLGVASRLRSTGSECRGGGVYTLAPAFADWVADNAPASRASGGGCSAAVGAPPVSAASMLVCLLALVALRLPRRARRNALFASASTFLVASFAACGDDDLASFCADDRDSQGLAFCDPDVARIDLATADTLVRQQLSLSDEVWLWRVDDGFVENNGLNPDGEAPRWRLLYHTPGDLREQLFIVEAPDTVIPSVNFISIETCVPTAPLQPLDSRRVVRDAIERFATLAEPVVLDDEVALALTQDHPCAVSQRELSVRNAVTVRRADGFVAAFYGDDGTFLFAQQTESTAGLSR